MSNLLNQLAGLLQQYAGAKPDQAPGTVDDDFEQFTRAVPPSTLAQGLAEAFRSNQTPPFEQMVAQLFGQSNGFQKASILNKLIGVAGPALLAQFTNRGGASGLANLFSGGEDEI